MATMQDVQDALGVVSLSLGELTTSVNALIAKEPQAEDTAPIVAAVVALNDGIVALKAAVDAKLTPPA